MRKRVDYRCIGISAILVICVLFLGIQIGRGSGGRVNAEEKNVISQEVGLKTEKTAPEHVAATLETSAAQLDKMNVEVMLSASESWKNGEGYFTKLEGKITNNSGEEIKDWKVTAKLKGIEVVDNGWNGKYALENEQLIIEPESYNNKIKNEETVEFGLIVRGKEAAVPSEISLNLDKEELLQSADEVEAVVARSETVDEAKPSEAAGDWLYVKGNKIVDADGTQVWITGINWFGYNTGTNTFDGLWAASLDDSVEAIADRGFNLIRVPISTELIKAWSNGVYPKANYNEAVNSYLKGKNSLQIFDYFLEACEKNGLKIMLDIHSAQTDSMGHMKNVWYEGDITEEDYYNALAFMAKRYSTNDTLIAFDLKNEPHGKPNENPKAIWNNSQASNNWKYAAEKAALCVLKENPNVLIMVEGIEIYPKDINSNGDFSSVNDGDYYFNWWGGNLRGVKDYPINLGDYQNKLVYSPHDYGPAVYEQPWLQGNYTYESLYKNCWKDNWFYIYEDHIAPLLIGEWGGYMTQPNLKWMTYLRKLIVKNKLHHTFWCFNANSGDTGGLVKDDFVTWDEEKYAFVKEALWNEKGKFVGLDQEIPLGKNGIALSALK